MEEAAKSRTVSGWAVVIVVVVSAVLVGLMLLLPAVGLPLNILGTAYVALGFGGRAVMLVGSMGPLVEAAVNRSCLVAVVLGTVCFEPFEVRIWVAAVAMLLWITLELLEARLAAQR
ncbi:MAG: hypothetical protein ACK5KO_07450 [Arachnia sp.]